MRRNVVPIPEETKQTVAQSNFNQNKNFINKKIVNDATPQTGKSEP